MIPMGRHRQQHQHVTGLIDREQPRPAFADAGAGRCRLRAGPARGWPAIAWIDADVLLALVEGDAPEATVRYRAVEAARDAFEARVLTAGDLVPYADGYHRRLLSEIRPHVIPA